ncbi:MAG: SDR family oxidoreductase [Dehalococcoidia bacterium]|jgi:NAD(P)-dependent dehydrogenase (short-subunit alcohol dehydrogenase family)|nr:short-chain dehydrogenase [Chloroflexota bacterium]MDP6056039.1 SDR family oxidoreductase [Dehalococcoidia bacterium]MDP7091147.1 SDR family oxidoreductase [Dehalococcoidia bacterium]MDP7261170.1 SDR family oxidoreductase [Dehalococcoidia bacterium]MDP7485727.1 SDR family oxidoreductase [Dehalococcoidia bacterium]
MAGRLEGKIAHITGGGSGLGDAMAHLFASEGARVIVSDLKLEISQRVADSVVAKGGDAIALAGDVSSREQCEALIADTVSQMGGIDILVNSAGVTPRYAPSEWDFEKTWDWVVSINLKGTMMMSRYAVAEMKKQRSGSIVNLASIIGLVGYAQGISDGFNPYPHTKGGVVQMTRDMSIALAKEGIRVNSLCPGFTYTPLVTTLVEDTDMHERLKSLHPMGRLGKPAEIANAALFLASDEASFITGANLPVDGGYTAQ